MWAQTLLHCRVRFNVLECESWEAFKGVGFGRGVGFGLGCWFWIRVLVLAPSTLVADESAEDQDFHWDNY
jgi:hypothetical protein